MEYVNDAARGASSGYVQSKMEARIKAKPGRIGKAITSAEKNAIGKVSAISEVNATTKAKVKATGRTRVKEKVSAAKEKAGGRAGGKARARAKEKTSASRIKKSAKTKNMIKDGALLVRARASTGDEIGASAAIAKALRGIDVSSYQGKIDWNVVAQSNIDFVFIKATEGGCFVDPNYASNISAAREAKIPCGAYHFFRPKISVEKQVNNFVKAVGKMQTGDLQPVLDLESASNWDSISADKRIELIESWVAGVSEALKCNVTLYMSSSFAQELSVETTGLSKYALWIAHYTEDPRPWVPKEWPTWSFWQYTNKGRVEGISVAVDLDLFNGTTEQLGKFRAP